MHGDTVSDEGGDEMALAAAVPMTQAVLFDADARCFDRGLLRRAMVMRRMELEDMVRATGLARSTVQKARSGRSVSDATAIAILRTLERVPPMEVL